MLHCNLHAGKQTITSNVHCVVYKLLLSFLPCCYMQLLHVAILCCCCRLFNKESLIEFLLDRSKFECASNFSYIRGLRVSDMYELNTVVVIVIIIMLPVFL